MKHNNTSLANEFTLNQESTDLVHIKLKLAEYALRESNEKYRVTFENVSIGIAHVAPNGQFLEVNQKLCNMLGRSRNELLNLSFGDLTHPDDLQESFEQAKRLLDGTISTSVFEKKYLLKNGDIIWGQVNTTLQRFSSGRPKYFISAVEDITNRKNTEFELKALNQKLQMINEELRMKVKAMHPISEPIS